MHTIRFEPDAVSVEATLIAESFAIEPAQVQSLMREGKLTGLCERGEGQDAGRHRLTFYYGEQCASVLIDATGKVLQRATGQARPRQGTRVAAR